MVEAAAEMRPFVLDPNRALGWRSIGLDGLGCYLRSVEAVLIQQGYEAGQVATGLAQPLDLVRRGGWYGPVSDYPACRLRWHDKEFGRDAWPHIELVLGRGGAVILMYDGYHWPGDPYEGAHHYHHHMVLAHRLDGATLHLLDIDAPAAAGYRSTVPLNESVIAACKRYAVFERVTPPGLLAPPAVAESVAGSVRSLAEDIVELDAFHRLVWTGGELTPILAKGLHVLVLGDIQPQLFLLGQALGAAGENEVARALLAAAGRAQKLGLLLIGLHRFNSGGIYEIAHEELPALVRSLESLLESMCSVNGVERPRIDATDGSRFVRRLLGETQWCFGEGQPLPELTFG
jgi:hypothetical protein